MTDRNRTPDPVDEVFVVLSHRRRRMIMLIVAATIDRSVDLRTLATILYSIENGLQPREAPTRNITNLRTNLKRSHIPKLTAAGVLVSEDYGETLTAGPAFGMALHVLVSAGYWLGTAPNCGGDTDHTNTY